MTTSVTTTQTARAKKSCFSCRTLKIACDKALPACTSCRTRGKTCSGYSENLSWPRKGDKRRAATANVRSRSGYRANPAVFLNTSSWDCNIWVPGHHRSHQAIPYGHPSLVSDRRTSNTISYPPCHISIPSLSVRHSMNAISLLSLHKSNEALRYKILAISNLKGAITQGLDNKSRPQAIATSLLLTLYEHWQQRTPQMEVMAKSDILVSDSAYDIDLVTMHNMLGCSPEVLDFLSEAMDLVRNRNDPSYLSLKRLRAINELEQRLKEIDDMRDCFDVGEDITISKVAESMNDRLFQFALIIYVDRVVKGAFMSSSTAQSAATKAFSLLDKIRLYDRPFPLFILSIQAETDEHRLLILSTIKRTMEARPMNNLGSTEEMIKKLWAQQDLQGQEQADALFLLNAVISASNMPPTFTSPFVINAITGANGVPFLSI
ncbi:hypothetical protein TARUN_4131 [Trichoderma arundinaceum]|uniref:Zn(2)-C6 fungal-type domain-containing protein n=1 Tax=Trichoderma arundinaceum TaxID=490622 RepID=A0A395NPS9_TRIAR|nr:hypothetical protein TARUN_4131 [Trichoderma arundinaceum]